MIILGVISYALGCVIGYALACWGQRIRNRRQARKIATMIDAENAKREEDEFVEALGRKGK